MAFWQAPEQSDAPLADALANVVSAAQRLVTEHMEQGLMGWFHVTDDKAEAAAHAQHQQ